MGETASNEVTQVAAATSSQDPEVGLAAVAALRGLVEVLEALQVENARAKGWSWQQIAARLASPSRPCTTSTPADASASGGSRMVQRSEQACRVLDLARAEAELFGHRYLGPEHLVLGVLRHGDSGARRALRSFGVDLAAARAELARLADRGVVAGPRPSDAELLGSLGIDLEAVRRDTEQAFGGRAVGWAVREATRARRRGVGRVPRTPLRDPPMLIGQVLYHAGEQARAFGAGEVGPELLLLGVVTDIQTPWPRCMNNRWRRQLHASVGLSKDYRGAAGPLLGSFGVNLDELSAALLAEFRAGVP
jgi:hypothetical protein